MASLCVSGRAPVLLASLVASVVWLAQPGAQQPRRGPVPPPPPPGPTLVIKGATVMTVTRGVIPNGVIIVRDGRLNVLVTRGDLFDERMTIARVFVGGRPVVLTPKVSPAS